jgi:hypothetical protein
MQNMNLGIDEMVPHRLRDCPKATVIWQAFEKI